MKTLTCMLNGITGTLFRGGNTVVFYTTIEGSRAPIIVITHPARHLCQWFTLC